MYRYGTLDSECTLVHYTFYTVHPALYTEHCTPYFVHCIILSIVTNSATSLEQNLGRIPKSGRQCGSLGTRQCSAECIVQWSRVHCRVLRGIIGASSLPPRIAVQCSVEQCTAQCSAVVQCSAVQCSAVQFSSEQCSAATSRGRLPSAHWVS